MNEPWKLDNKGTEPSRDWRLMLTIASTAILCGWGVGVWLSALLQQ